MDQIKVNFQYPYSDKYEYTAKLVRLNLDEERKKDILNDNGFVVKEPQNIRKDVKSDDSIFSSRFGQDLEDINTWADRYKCACKHLTGRVNYGETCPNCGTKVKYVGDKLDYFGWICLADPYYLIHPNIYRSLAFFIGEKKFERILMIVQPKNEDGFNVPVDRPDDEPFFGIGMIEFEKRFDEIMNYYLNENPNKINYYEDIMREREKVFIQSIPVFTTHLRPIKIEGNILSFEGTNADYNVLAKMVYVINRTNTKLYRKEKPKANLLYKAQERYNNIYKELVDIFAQKKGAIRSLFGGRLNIQAA